MTWEWPTSYGWAVPVPDDFDPESDVQQDARQPPLPGSWPNIPACEVEPRLVNGHPAPALVEASKGADLLVVGSRGHGEFVGMLIGSVSEYCVTNAPLPRPRAPRPGLSRRSPVGASAGRRLHAPPQRAPFQWRAGVPRRPRAAGRARGRPTSAPARRRAHRAARRASPPPTTPAPPPRTRLRGRGRAARDGAQTRGRCAPARRSPRSRAASSLRGSSRWASNPHETSTQSGCELLDASRVPPRRARPAPRRRSPRAAAGG